MSAASLAAGKKVITLELGTKEATEKLGLPEADSLCARPSPPDFLAALVRLADIAIAIGAFGQQFLKR